MTFMAVVQVQYSACACACACACARMLDVGMGDAGMGDAGGWMGVQVCISVCRVLT